MGVSIAYQDIRWIISHFPLAAFSSRSICTHHHVSIHPSSSRYLGLHWKGQTYVWTTLVFGLSVAPRIFQRLMMEMLQPMRRELCLACYLDNVLEVLSLS